MNDQDRPDHRVQRPGWARQQDMGRGADRHAPETHDHTEPRTGYRPELDDRTPRYGEYGLVRGNPPDDFAHNRHPGPHRDPRPSVVNPPERHARYTVESPGADGNEGSVMHIYRDRWADDETRFAPISRGHGEGERDAGHRGDHNAPRPHSASHTAPHSPTAHRDPHYQQWRDEQVRQLDADYDAWHAERYDKFAEDFNQWRTHRGSHLHRDALSPAEKDSAAPTAPGNNAPPSDQAKTGGGH